MLPALIPWFGGTGFSNRANKWPLSSQPPWARAYGKLGVRQALLPLVSYPASPGRVSNAAFTVSRLRSFPS
jgi:hypothetical protein